jgi:hypothetical protein
MEANCIIVRLSQYFRCAVVEPRERLIIHSGCGLVAKSVRTVAPHFRWYVISCAAGMTAYLWMFIL